MTEAFFKLHADLPREGPGSAADVEWAIRQAGVPRGARICDAGCGPGGDIAALLDAVPDSRLTAIDAHADFTRSVAERFGGPRVTVRTGDMTDLDGPFDFIWSAGAIYNVGIGKALAAWREALAPGGHVAFSHPAWFTLSPSDGARDFWQGYDDVRTSAALASAVDDAGYCTRATRPIADDGWEAYYGPQEARIATLRSGADDALSAVLDEAEEEIRAWRKHRAETGYLLTVVRPA